jgi:hypothetical protein
MQGPLLPPVLVVCHSMLTRTPATCQSRTATSESRAPLPATPHSGAVARRAALSALAGLGRGHCLLKRTSRDAGASCQPDTRLLLLLLLQLQRQLSSWPSKPQLARQPSQPHQATPVTDAAPCACTAACAPPAIAAAMRCRLVLLQLLPLPCVPVPAALLAPSVSTTQLHKAPLLQAATTPMALPTANISRHADLLLLPLLLASSVVGGGAAVTTAASSTRAARRSAGSAPPSRTSSASQLAAAAAAVPG